LEISRGINHQETIIKGGNTAVENNEERDLVQKPSVLKNIFNQEFIVSAIVPLLMFYIFHYQKMDLTGIILSGCWCVAVVLNKLIREHKVNVIALLAGIFSAVGLLGTILSRNPAFYLAAPIVIDVLWALIFFGSFFTPRPLIQVIAEDSHLGLFSEDFRQTRKYKSAWQIITAAWGVLNVTQALLRTILLYTVPMELYYTVSTLYSNISSPLLLVVSYTFPKWYWHRPDTRKGPILS
jgi:intracellular septation protein A